VLRDRRLRDADRLARLTAWLEAVQRCNAAVDHVRQAAVSLQEVKAACQEVKERHEAALATG